MELCNSAKVCVFLCVHEWERCCVVRLHVRRYIKKSQSLLPWGVVCVCVRTYVCDLHTNVCLVTQPVCLMSLHECQTATVCWPVLRERKDATSVPSGFYYKKLFCSECKPEAVKSSIIKGCLSPFIYPVLNLRAHCSNSGCYCLCNWDCS